MIKGLIVLTFLVSNTPFAKELGRMYFNKPFGHLHKSASKQSNSLTVIQCEHSVKLLKSKTKIPGWYYAQVGEDKGYVQSDFLSQERKSCFQGKYPRFYSKMNLDITDMYYWGRLYDQYLFGESRAK